MAKLVFGMMQSLDGYVDHLEMRPGPVLFRHFIEHARDLTGIVSGRLSVQRGKDKLPSPPIRIECLDGEELARRI